MSATKYCSLNNLKTGITGIVRRIIILEFGNIHCPIKVILLKIIVGLIQETINDIRGKWKISRIVSI